MPSAEDENPQDSFKKHLAKPKGLTRPGPNVTLGSLSGQDPAAHPQSW